MNEQQALAKMYAPATPREGIWRKGVLQICIIRSCDKACFHCTQGSHLRGKPLAMTPGQFKRAIDSLEGYFGVVGIFGGNPALHPQFDEICEILRNSWVPMEQRGLWCNKPFGKGWVMRKTFNPAVSNLNVHLDQAAYDEFAADWPECKKYLKGHDTDSQHSTGWVAMQDVVEDESERWELISNCDINREWSAYISTFRGELRAWFCEIAGAQARMHQDNPDYPDTGVAVVPGWWKASMHEFASQVRHHCHACGYPLRAKGQKAVNGEFEQVSKTHADLYLPKIKGREVRLVQTREELHEQALPRMTAYIENGRDV